MSQQQRKSTRSSTRLSQTEEPPDDLNRVFNDAFLEKSTSKKDLLRRLRILLNALTEDEDEEDGGEMDPSEYPGMAGLAQTLVDEKYLEHKDKEVRLYTVLACVELFYLYAPEPPWDAQEIMAIFSQIIRQLGNLAHCTSPSQTNFNHYFRLLDQLATVKIGIVLVELTRTLDDPGEALESLCELIRTILNLVHIDHPPEVKANAVAAVAACLEEFDTVPIPVLDELLQVISVGPVVMVTNPAAVEAAAKQAKKKNKSKLPPMQIEQANPSYQVAKTIVRRVGRISTPMAAFLNGLWNNDPNVTSQTSIPPENQSAIIYELHKISPPVLTTVIGTVTNSLQSPHADKRLEVVKLLGRLFHSTESKIGTQFRPCFREWLRRSTDIDVQVRSTMVKYLVSILSGQPELRDETTVVLCQLMEQDPSPEVRSSAIHKVCDLAYHKPQHTSHRLLHAVGNRVSSKTKTERRDALTGLAQIYLKHYMCPKTQKVQDGGDDCSIGLILDTLQDSEDDDEDDSYKWVPSKVFECACFTEDLEMRNRVIQIMDEVLLGKADSLSGTSRAVGLAMIVDSLQPNALKWFKSLLLQRARLQQGLERYLDARDKLRRAKSGSEEAMKTNALALDQLEVVNTLTAQGSEEVLEKFHAARDNHIFRILATLVTPTHSSKARQRALDDLPKRTKVLGEATAMWVQTLAKRCAMGYMVNLEIMHHCILLSQECFQEGDGDACIKFLACIQLVAEAFPTLCGKKRDFGTLLEFFSECREVQDYQSKRVMEKLGILTKLSAILATVAPKLKERGEIDSDLQSQLLNLCTRDGTPDQARHAVMTMAALMSPKPKDDGDEEEDDENDSGVDNKEQEEKAFGVLLKELTSPSRLRLDKSMEEQSKLISVLTALSALTESAPTLFASGRGKRAVALALNKFLLGNSSGFEDEDDEDDGDVDDDEEAPQTPVKTGRQSKSRRSPGKSPGINTPRAGGNLLEDSTLSVVCRRLCATIEFLVSYIRSSILAASQQEALDLMPPSDQVSHIFRLLHRMLIEKGLPPSSRDRKDCRSRRDRAALRECAAVSLFRLCDVRLSLERKHLQPAVWHTLTGALLDEEKSVRVAVMEELNAMLTGQGKYRPEGNARGPFAPSLRFVAMVTFCCDGEHSVGNSTANGNAANVGKLATATKTASMKCVSTLRRTCDATLHECRARGKAAEERFERSLKMMLMPEYAVPYALHLLSLRRETPAAGGTAVGVPGMTQLNEQNDEDRDEKNDGFMSVDDEAAHKILRRRLKWLFEPLILSLGDGANNISFLIRLCEMLGNNFQPIDVLATTPSTSMTATEIENVGSESVTSSEEHNLALLVGKLKTTCVAAREVLMSYVKKDINLSPYPGQIQLPMTLFKKLSGAVIAKSTSTKNGAKPKSISRKRKSATTPRRSSARKKLESRFDDEDERDDEEKDLDDKEEEAEMKSSNNKKRKSNKGTPVSRRSSRRTRSSLPSTVQFSPDVETSEKTRSRKRRKEAPMPDDSNDEHFGDVSPITKASSSVDGRDNDDQDDQGDSSPGTKTAGSTPPSTLRSGWSEELTDPEDSKPAALPLDSSPAPKRSSRRRGAKQASTKDSKEDAVQEKGSTKKAAPKKANKNSPPVGARRSARNKKGSTNSVAEKDDEENSEASGKLKTRVLTIWQPSASQDSTESSVAKKPPADEESELDGSLKDTALKKPPASQGSAENSTSSVAKKPSQSMESSSGKDDKGTEKEVEENGKNAPSSGSRRSTRNRATRKGKGSIDESVDEPKEKPAPKNKRGRAAKPEQKPDAKTPERRSRGRKRKSEPKPKVKSDSVVEADEEDDEKDSEINSGRRSRKRQKSTQKSKSVKNDTPISQSSSEARSDAKRRSSRRLKNESVSSASLEPTSTQESAPVQSSNDTMTSAAVTQSSIDEEEVRPSTRKSTRRSAAKSQSKKTKPPVDGVSVSPRKRGRPKARDPTVDEFEFLDTQQEKENGRRPAKKAKSAPIVVRKTRSQGKGKPLKATNASAPSPSRPTRSSSRRTRR